MQTVGNETVTDDLHKGHKMCRSIMLRILFFSSIMRLADGTLPSSSPSPSFEAFEVEIAESVNVDVDCGVVKTCRGVNMPRVRGRLGPQVEML